MLNSGCNNSCKTFILTDSEIVEESFLEDVDQLLNSGEVADNFYNKDDYDRINEALSVLNLAPTAVYPCYVSQLRSNFHIVLCVSPVGDLLRKRCRMFPSLVNCCTLVWFSEWPEAALKQVVQKIVPDANTNL